MNPTEVLTRILRVIREDPTGLIMPPPQASAQPSPEQIGAEAKLISANAQQTRAQVSAADSATDAQIKTAQLSTEKDIATVNLAKEMVIHRDDSARADKAATAEAGLAAQKHNLAASQAVHDRNMDLAQHALNVHEVLNPPPPNDSGGNT